MTDSGAKEKHLDRGATIGRYVVLNMLGKGGMGEVYAAYDPELDRKIAIKLLRTKSQVGMDASEGRARLLREAQAIAKLSHGNVVTVYDVGTFEERVFLAMEFVEGGTLGFWTQAQKRTWRETLKVFLAAGRGLAAAHAAGIVHRDFKPENVMVGADGKVRVMDFGLARVTPPGGETPGIRTATSELPTPGPARITGPVRITGAIPAIPAPQPSVVSVAEGQPWAEGETETRNLSVPTSTPSPSASVPPAFNLALTQEGAMVGTPAYMAPEQFKGGTSDARSDQFSFCVALYEALFEQRPFAAKSLEELTANVTAGRVREPPAKSPVPSSVRRAVLRGLRPSPNDRFPSMDALIDELERDPARARRQWMAAGAITAAVAVGAFGLNEMAQRGRRVCEGAEARLEGIWSFPKPGAQRPGVEAIRRAFVATGKKYAPDAFAAVSRALDRYVTGWTTMYKDTCEATHVRGEQSAEVLDLRMSCLNERLGEVRALVRVFAEADRHAVENAVQAVSSLRPIDPCADVATLRAVVRPPDDPKVRQAVATVRDELAEVKALADAGRYADGLKRARKVTEAARQTAYDPVIAESLVRYGLLQTHSGQHAEAESSFEEALWLAEATRHDVIAAEAATSLIFATGYAQTRVKEGERWSRLAQSLIARLGPGHELLASWRLNNLGAVQGEDGQWAAASATLGQAVELKRKTLGEQHFDVAISLGNLAYALAGEGRLDDAIARSAEAQGILEKTLGQYHPLTARELANQAEFKLRAGDPVDAEGKVSLALSIAEASLPPEHPDIGSYYNILGLVRIRMNHPAEATKALERALRIREATRATEAELKETRAALAQARAKRKIYEARNLQVTRAESEQN